jgi:hypothetical protein
MPGSGWPAACPADFDNLLAVQNVFSPDWIEEVGLTWDAVAFTSGLPQPDWEMVPIPAGEYGAPGMYPQRPCGIGQPPAVPAIFKQPGAKVWCCFCSSADLLLQHL